MNLVRVYLRCSNFASLFSSLPLSNTQHAHEYTFHLPIIYICTSRDAWWRWRLERKAYIELQGEKWHDWRCRRKRKFCRSMIGRWEVCGEGGTWSQRCEMREGWIITLKNYTLNYIFLFSFLIFWHNLVWIIKFFF